MTAHSRNHVAQHCVYVFTTLFVPQALSARPPGAPPSSSQELEKTREALSAKKAALDKSWAETKELKRSLAELRAAKDVRTTDRPFFFCYDFP